MLHFRMANHRSRRSFLASAAALPFAELILTAQAHADLKSPTEPFKLYSAEELADTRKSLPVAPAPHYIYEPKTIPMAIAIQNEGPKVAADFELHENRDHIFLVLSGSAKFELGGTLQTPRNTKPGEWLAPSSTGATTVPVKAGDMLLVPRQTPHRQSTETGVQWMLISTTGVPTP